MNQQTHSLDQWLTMWNSDGDLAGTLCADDFRSADDFARYLAVLSDVVSARRVVRLTYLGADQATWPVRSLG